jgi:hypothetical protein
MQRMLCVQIVRGSGTSMSVCKDLALLLSAAAAVALQRFHSMHVAPSPSSCCPAHRS